MSTILQPLTGHTTPDTAYIVDDYPYGFRLRCKMRYWLEYAPGKGFRLCSQTTNPKIASAEVWNKPKKSTYSMLGVMGLDEEKHVTWTGCNVYQFDELQAFEATYGLAFDDNQRKVCIAALKAYEYYLKRKKVAAR